jgi:uncharacterized repeat protein (TIGR01451 family)
MRLPLFFSTALVAGLFLAPPPAVAQNGVTVALTAHRVTLVDGREALLRAEQARPGDVVEYRVEYRNQGVGAARELQATLPIPAGMEYVPRSATPGPVLASLDGRGYSPVPLTRRVRLADGREVVREVPAAEYRFLRWPLGTLKPRATRAVSARVRVTPLEVAALAR